MTTHRIYFSPMQRYVLEDRLDDWEKVADSTGLDPEECRIVCENLKSSLQTDYLVAPFYPAEKTVLVDVVEKSTTVAYHFKNGRASRASHGVRRAMKNIADKLRPAGVEINHIPTN